MKWNREEERINNNNKITTQKKSWLENTLLSLILFSSRGSTPFNNSKLCSIDRQYHQLPLVDVLLFLTRFSAFTSRVCTCMRSFTYTLSNHESTHLYHSHHWDYKCVQNRCRWDEDITQKNTRVWSPSVIPHWLNISCVMPLRLDPLPCTSPDTPALLMFSSQ